MEVKLCLSPAERKLLSAEQNIDIEERKLEKAGENRSTKALIFF